MTRGKRWMVLIAILLPLATLSLAQDDVDFERQDLMEEIDGYLDEIEDDLKRLLTETTARGAEAAINTTDELSRALSDLDDVAEDDAEAEDRADDWPAIVRDFITATTLLAKMKEGQYTFDDLAATCESGEKSLARKIAEYERDLDVVAYTKLPELGDHLGKPIFKQLNAHKDLVLDMDAHVDKIDDFRAAGDWAPVNDQLQAAAKAINTHVTRVHAEAVESCSELAKAKDHREILGAIRLISDQVQELTEGEINSLRAGVKAWYTEATKYTALDCEELERVRQSVCGLDHEPTERITSSAPRSGVDRVKNNMRTGLRQLAREFERLAAQAKQVREDATARGLPALLQEARAVMREVGPMYGKLKKIEREGTLLGWNHPQIQAAAKYGVQQHKILERRHRCDVADQAFDSSRRRPDCVRADGCQLLEFKPKTPAAVKKGQEQLRDYLPRIRKYYEDILRRKGRDARVAPSDKLGGQAILDAFHKNRCIVGGRLTLRPKVVTYDLCDASYRCQK